MPRKDRRFTADDVLRFYCKNLAADQRTLLDAIGFYCGDIDDRQERLLRVLKALTEPPLSEVVDLLPGGNYISKALDIIYAIAVGEISLEGVELIPGEFIFIGRDLQPYVNRPIRPFPEP